MSQFKIKGIDYPDDSLEHGLGKGSGRGRPKGSKNGQVMPGAAYMKGYDVVGKKAVGEAALPGAKNTRRTQTVPNPVKNYGGSGGRKANRSAAPASSRPKYGSATISAKSVPAANVARGRSAVAQLMGGGVNPLGQARPLEGIPKRKLQDSQGRTIIEKDARQQSAAQNENLLDRAGRAVTDAANAAGRWVGNAANDVGRTVTNAANAAGQWVGDTAQNVGNAVGGAVNDAARGANRLLNGHNTTVTDQTGRNIATQHHNGILDNGRNLLNQAGNTAQNVGNAVGVALNDAGQWIGNTAQNVGNAVSGAVNDAGQWVGNTARNVGNAVTGAVNDAASSANRLINGYDTTVTDQTGRNIATQHNNGLIDNGRNLLNQAGQLVSDTAQNVSNTVSNAVNGSRQETPEQKSIWDRVGGWFSQAGKDIADTAVGAWNATSGAVTDAANWIGDRLGDAGEWAQTAYDDVSDWVGDRGRDLSDWWNGKDIEVNDNGRWVQSHQTGVGEGINNALNAAGQWLGNAANDVGQWVGNTANNVSGGANRLLNGYNTTVTDQTGRNIATEHHNGLLENGGNLLNQAGQWIGDTAQNVGNFVGQAANNTWNGHLSGQEGDMFRLYHPGMRDQLFGNQEYGIQGLFSNPAGFVNQQLVEPIIGRENAQNVGNAVSGALNAAGQWVGDTAQNVGNALNGAGQWIGDVPNDVGRAANNLADNVLGRYQVIDTDENGNLIYGDQRQGGALNRAVRDAGRWVDDNVIVPVANAANSAGEFVRNAANTAGQAVGNAAANAGNWIGNAAADTGHFLANITDPATISYLQSTGNWDYVNSLRRQVDSGEMTPSQYNYHINNMLTHLQNRNR